MKCEHPNQGLTIEGNWKCLECGEQTWSVSWGPDMRLADEPDSDNDAAR